ncbi:MAG: hypothetical protein ABI472_23175 [Ginsengibacter sp.]
MRKKTAPPYIPGAEVAGTIAGIGSAITSFEVSGMVLAIPPTDGYA